MQKFTIQRVTETLVLPPEGVDVTDSDVSYDEGSIEPADLREALDALDSQCWDSLDLRGDGTIIGYPADGHRDLVTGDEERVQLILKARRPEWAERLLDIHEARAAR